MDKFKKLTLDKKVVLDNKIVFCKQCGERYAYKSMGVYECPSCGFSEMDNYGKVRMYLEEKGPTSAVIIADETKVPVDVITRFLREGRVEIPDGSGIYIRCERCKATEIRYGRFCPACALELSKQISGALNTLDVGEVPKYKTGKMRYLDNK